MNLDSNLSTMERRMMDRAVSAHIPINGSIELLPVCNMNCDMCYVRLTPEEVRRQGRIRTVEEWLEIVRQMKESGVLYLLLTGGEPLLYPGFRDLYSAIRKTGMVVTINTNGTLLDESWADFFAQEPPRRINITLYGSSADSYEKLCHYREGFSRVRSAIQLLRDREIDVKLGTSVTRKNVQDLEAMHAIAAELGVTLHADTYMMPSVRERELPFAYQVRLSPKEAAHARVDSLRWELSRAQFEEWRERMVWQVEHILPEEGPYKNHCYAGQCSFTVNWQGELHPCVVLDKPAASVFEYGFLEAWERVTIEFLSYSMSAECSACKYRPLCRTCLGSTSLETGNYEKLPVYMCEYARETYYCLKKMETQHKESCKK